MCHYDDRKHSCKQFFVCLKNDLIGCMIVAAVGLFVVQKRYKFLEKSSFDGWFIKTHGIVEGIFANHCFFVSVG